MDQRQEFVMAQLAGEIPFAELCRRYQVSRKTGYKWVRRFLDGGLPALIGRSRAPHSHPHAVDSASIDAIIALKKRYPSWGPKKLKARLERDAPQVGWPSETTFARILKRHGLVEGRRRIRRTPRAEHPLGVADEPNHIWCADFKGKFRVGGRYCHPLTVTDAKSRFVLCCHDTGGERLAPTQADVSRVWIAATYSD